MNGIASVLCPFGTRLRHFRQILAGCCLAFVPFHGFAELPYPGPQPGPAKIAQQQGRITAGNRAIVATWQLDGQGLRSLAVRDEQAKAALMLTGEVFRILLSDGTLFNASSLQQHGQVPIRKLVPAVQASRFSDRIGGRKVEVPLRSADGRIEVLWRVLAHDGANYLRQEIDVVAAKEDLPIKEIAWLNNPNPGASTAGRVDGSPVVAGSFFLGCEDPMAVNAGGAGNCRVPRNAILPRGERLVQSFVLGVAPAGQLRRAFLYYLERERAHPYRPFLHYNSWYDIAWSPFALNETNCLDAIHSFGTNFLQPYGVIMDAMVFDDGWDDPKTLWQFHGGFPDGFTPLAQLCRRYHTGLGVWLSPFGGYGEPKNQRLKYGKDQGYEINATGFSLAGPKYYERFKSECIQMIQSFGVNHFKFNGIASGAYANGAGSDYLLDTEAMRRLMLELRQEDPNLYINLTTGSWPSPFWLRYADSVWRQGGDMGLAGKGGKQQQWLTYRDQETFRNIVGKGPLYPLNSLMTQGVAYSREGSAGERTFDSAGFKDDVRTFFGSGTGLQELYIQPGKLKTADWRVLAEAAKWSRANADVLVDTHWIGGDPARPEVYGWASWTPRKGIITLRNPDDRPSEFTLDVGTAFELPTKAAKRYSLRSPWAEDTRKPAHLAQAGKPLKFSLEPFEVLTFDATPAP